MAGTRLDYEPDPVSWSHPYGSTRAGGAQLLLQTLDLRLDKALDFFMFMSVGYIPWMMENGLRLLAAGSHLTGVPGRVVHVWEVGEPLRDAPSGRPKMLDLLDAYVSREEVHVLTPTAYDPARFFTRGALPKAKWEEPPDRSTRVFLIDTIQVQAGRMRGFVRGKSEMLVPLLTDPPRHAASHAWTLVASGWLRGSDAPAAVNVWSLPEADSLLATMLRVSENTAYQEFVRACVKGEDQHLLGPLTAYDPRPVLASNGALYYRE